MKWLDPSHGIRAVWLRLDNRRWPWLGWVIAMQPVTNVYCLFFNDESRYRRAFGMLLLLTGFGLVL